MTTRFLQFALSVYAALALSTAVAQAASPTRIGQCVGTRVKEVGTRLENTPGSGSLVTFTNGGVQVSYDQVREVDESRRGDRVSMCLVSIPKDCPPGDDRGRTYKTTNKRTGQSWTLPDSEHMCGGA
ncbi:MAG: hypothetical protein WA813_00810 [Beijerinckiaceae bacterium]